AKPASTTTHSPVPSRCHCQRFIADLLIVLPRLPVQGPHTPFMHTDRTRCNAPEKPVGCERVLLAEGNSIALGLLSLAAFGPLTGTFTPPGVSALQATVIVGDRCGVSYVRAVECLAPCPDPPAGLGAGCPHDPVQF